MNKKDFPEDKKKNEIKKTKTKIHYCTRTPGYHRSDDFPSVERINKRGYPIHF